MGSITSSEKWEEMANQGLFFQTQEGGAGGILDRFSLEDMKSVSGEVRVCLQLCAYKVWGKDGWIKA